MQGIVRWMGWLPVALALVLAAGAARAGEEEERAVKARRYFENGMAHFNLQEWDGAIEEWQAGYRTKPVPQFLYNIAQAYRKSNRPEKAVTYYRTYLHQDPNAPNRAELEQHIDALNKVIEAEKAAPPPQPATKTTAEPARQAAGPAVDVPAATATVQVKAPRPAASPVYKKWWLWTAVGVVAVGVGVGVGLAVGLPHTSYPAAAPGASGDGNFRF